VHVVDRVGAPIVADDFIVGSSHTCALLPGGDVSCWGHSVGGECGRMSKHDASGNWIPVLEHNVVFRGATRLLGGGDTSCAVDAREQLFCWGSQDAGYSGKGDVATPTHIAIEGHAKAMSFGSGHSCLLNDAGAVFCRGWNPGGQLGSAGRPQKELDGKGPWHDDFEPKLVRITEFGRTYTRVSASRHETCAVSTDRDLTCIGTPDWTTPLERGLANASMSPSQPHCQEKTVPPPASFRLPVGPSGSSDSSSRGPGPAFTSWTCSPAPDPKLTDVIAVAATMGRRCTLHGDGRVRCVGQRRRGRTVTIDDEPLVLDLPR
jgi:hypothetical protein